MFIVTAYRHGDKELHSYVVGMFNTIDRATKASEDETQWRGGKYYCEILSMRVNETHREFRNVAQELPKI
jgi:hypothetical protein